MIRLALIPVVGVLAALPLATYAQAPQTATNDCKSTAGGLPNIGFITGAPQGTLGDALAALRQGLKDSGYVEDQNLRINYRSPSGRAGETHAQRANLLLDCNPAVIIATGGTDVAEIAREEARKKAAAPVPVVFATGLDPARVNITPNHDQPTTGATGVAMQMWVGVRYQLELLRQLKPALRLSNSKIGMIMNPLPPQPKADGADARAEVKRSLQAELGGNYIVEVQTADDDTFRMGLRTAFAQAARDYQGLLVGASPIFAKHHKFAIELAAEIGKNNSVPTLWPLGVFAENGGLISYGINLQKTYYELGLYAGKILNGVPPAELPVLTNQSELIVNLDAAKDQGIPVPAVITRVANKVIGSIN